MSIIFHPQDEWVITRLSKSYALCLTQIGTEWSGHYTDVNNASQFAGTIVTGQGITLVHFLQTTPKNNYYAVHAGKLVRPHRIKGHWYDTAGNAGAFTLECPSPSDPNLDEVTDEAIGDAIANAKHRAMASRLPKVPEPPQPEPPLLPTPELEARLKHVHHLIEVRNYPAALSQLEQLHRRAPQSSQVFNLLTQIFLQEWIGYGAIVANHKAQCLNPQDEFAQANAIKIQQLGAPRDPDQYHPDRPPHAQYYRLLSERYPALFAAIDQCRPINPTAGVMVDHLEQLGSYSPYQSLLGNLGPPSVVGPLAGTAIAPKPRERNINPGRVAPPNIARQPPKPWWQRRWQRWWQRFRRVWLRRSQR